MRIGVKMGCFTLLMPHHVETLRRCKEHCDELIVVINSDQYVQDKKGCVPLNSFERRDLLLATKYVDSVVISEDQDMGPFVEELYDRRNLVLKPDHEIIIFHSHEMEESACELPGAPWAAEIMTIQKINGTRSVSEVFEAIRRSK